MKKSLYFIIKSFFLVIVSFGLAPIAGKVYAACPDINLQILQQPTAAMKWVWAPAGKPNTGGQNWALTDGQNIMSSNITGEIVPSTGQAMPTGTKGIAFSMFTRIEPKAVAKAPLMGGHGALFAIEYTFPSLDCMSKLTWQTKLTLSFPNGICLTEESVGNNCLGVHDPNQWRLHIVFFSLSDPDGKMGIVDSDKRHLLKGAIKGGLGNTQRRIDLPDNPRQAFSRTITVKDTFTMKAGVEPKVYMIVSPLLYKMNSPRSGQICTRDCLTYENESLMEHAVFKITGSDGGITYATTSLD